MYVILFLFLSVMCCKWSCFFFFIRMKYVEEATLHRVSQDVLLKMCDGDNKEENVSCHEL